jgi:hypothetical protein
MAGNLCTIETARNLFTMGIDQEENCRIKKEGQLT